MNLFTTLNGNLLFIFVAIIVYIKLYDRSILTRWRHVFDIKSFVTKTKVLSDKSSLNASDEDDSEDYYNTNNSKLGVALIFNHRKFEDRSPERCGTKEDEENLWQVLMDFGFDVRIFEDFTKDAIEKELEKG